MWPMCTVGIEGIVGSACLVCRSVLRRGKRRVCVLSEDLCEHPTQPADAGCEQDEQKPLEVEGSCPVGEEE